MQTTNHPQLPLLISLPLPTLGSSVRELTVRLVNVGSMAHAVDILAQINFILSHLSGLVKLELQVFDVPNPQYHRSHFAPNWLMENGLPSTTSCPQRALRDLRVTNATDRQVNYVQLQLIVAIVVRCPSLLSLHLLPHMGGVLPSAADVTPHTKSAASETVIAIALEGIALDYLTFGWAPFAFASALLSGARKMTLRTLEIRSQIHTNGMVGGQPTQISLLNTLLPHIHGLSSLDTLIIAPPRGWYYPVSFLNTIPVLLATPSLRQTTIKASVLSESVTRAVYSRISPNFSGLVRVRTLKLLCDSTDGDDHRGLPYILQILAGALGDIQGRNVNGLRLREIALIFPPGLTRYMTKLDVSLLRRACMAERVKLRIFVDVGNSFSVL